MADNKNPSEKQRTDHYNPGNQAGKSAGVIKNSESEKEGNADRKIDRKTQKR